MVLIWIMWVAGEWPPSLVTSNAGAWLPSWLSWFVISTASLISSPTSPIFDWMKKHRDPIECFSGLLIMDSFLQRGIALIKVFPWMGNSDRGWGIWTWDTWLWHGQQKANWRYWGWGGWNCWLLGACSQRTLSSKEVGSWVPWDQCPNP